MCRLTNIINDVIMCFTNHHGSGTREVWSMITKKKVGNRVLHFINGVYASVAEVAEFRERRGY